MFCSELLHMYNNNGNDTDIGILIPFININIKRKYNKAY